MKGPTLRVRLLALACVALLAILAAFGLARTATRDASPPVIAPTATPTAGPSSTPTAAPSAPSTTPTSTAQASAPAPDGSPAATGTPTAPGASSPAPTATPTTRPTAPTSAPQDTRLTISVKPGNSQATVTWQAPDNGALTVSYAPAGSDDWLTVVPATTAQTQLTLAGLTNGVRYTVTATWTAPGKTSASAVAHVTPYTTPGDVRDLRAADTTTGALTITWQPPSSDDGNPVQAYDVAWAPTASGPYASLGRVTDTRLTLTSPPARPHILRVRAVNSAGAGPWTALARSATGTPTSVADRAPGQATGLTATPGDQYVDLTWQVPTRGGPVDDYQVSIRAAGGTWKNTARSSATSTRARITGLTNGTSYEFRVSARNDAGTGPWSPTASAAPQPVPADIAELTVAPSDSAVSLTWDPPSNSKALAGVLYEVTWTAAGEAPVRAMRAAKNTLITSDTRITITGLVNGVEYEFLVRAVNYSGQSAWARSERVTTYGLPGAPTGISATPEGPAVSLTWRAPATTGGADITGYVVEQSDSTGTWTALPATVNLGLTVTDLANGPHSFRVSARTKAGQGPHAGPVTVSVNAPAPGAPTITTPATAPGAPTSVTAGPGNTQVTLTWTAPASTGGAAITDYQIEYRIGAAAWTTVTDGVSAATTAIVPGLVNGTSYEFRVAAVNSAGTSAWSATDTATPCLAPDAPTGLAATLASTQVALTWTAPASDGGSPITDYQIEYRAGAGAWSTFADGVGTGTSATVTGLTNGTAYEFRVAAVNSAGAGAASATTTSTPCTFPDNVGNLAAAPGDTQLTATWTAPASDGGSPITDYQIEFRTGAGAWTTVTDGVSTATNAIVPGLVNGTSYDVRVTAINSVGTSAGAIVLATPYTVPGAPTGLGATPSSTQVALAWTAPASNGGSALTDYVLEYRIGAGAWTTLTDGVGTGTSATVTGLTNGTAYEFRVSAVNIAGTSAASATATATPAAVADAPTGLGTTPSSTQVTLAWTAPGSTGGSPITDYVVEYRIGAAAWTTFTDGVGTGTSTTVTGLTNGTAYEFQVSAVNAAGTGAASGPATATPYTVPDAPTGLGATPGNAAAVLAWTAPVFNGGNAITSYTVTAAPGGSTCTATAPAVTCTVTGLANGTLYTFTVTATNAAGAGSASASASETPYTVPDAPTGLGVTAGNAQVALTWGAPVFNGGRAITDYTVEYRIGAGAWSTFTDGVTATTGATVTGLTNGTAYEFRVSAVNAAGTGAASASASETPYTVPDAPTGLGGVPGNAQVALTWTAPAFNGGRAITDYTVEYRIGAAAWSTFADGVGTGTSATVTGLTNGTAYEFRVAAVTIAGTGAASTSASDTPYTVPDNVGSLTATPGNTQLAMTWTAPVFNGGRAITDYVVEYRIGAAAWTTFTDGVTATTGATVTGLANGTNYDVRVTAVNAAGSSAGAIVTATPYTVPDAPTGLGATPGNAAAVLAWTAPASNGGNAITSYTVTAAPGGSTCTATAPAVTCTVTGLANGTLYTFTVTATNAAGTGAASGSASTTPYIPFNAATGGTITDVTNYNGTGETWRIHTFTSGSTLTVTDAPNPFSYLVLGGGGGGHHGNDFVYGGNGGGGGLLTGTTTLSVSSYPVTVAAGGAVNNDAPNSTFNGLTARGGGAGGFGGVGSIGGSGGGGQGFTGPTGGGAGTAGQGYAGGTGASGGYGGGGGGAGGAGGTGGTPGPGVSSTISGSSYEYGRGGAPNVNPTMYGQGGWGSGCCGQQPVAGYQGIVIVAYRIG